MGITILLSARRGSSPAGSSTVPRCPGFHSSTVSRCYGATVPRCPGSRFQVPGAQVLWRQCPKGSNSLKACKNKNLRAFLLPEAIFPKTSAQKSRFYAQNARKWGSRSPKKYKNPDFVFKRGKNQGKIALSDTKIPILCSKSPKTRVPKAKSAQKSRFCAREDGKVASGNGKLASGSIT